jgi:hypothetical protein
MRPHVELIDEADYVWHGAELIKGSGRASERRLSVDEEDGSSSLRVDFHTDWNRGPGIHHANTEYYVLDGEMKIGGQTIGKGGYVQAPKGVPMDSILFKEGTKLLHYREYGDAGFDEVDSVKAPRWKDAAHGDITIIDSEAMKWDEVQNAGPMPGLLIKYLKVDPVTGFYTRLVHAKEGWTDHRLAHHPCYEEAYTVQGSMSYNFGDLTVGTYFFRPARVKHGHFVSLEGGSTWLLRSDGELSNWYSQNEYVRWGADAVNYSPEGDRMSWSQSTHDMSSVPTWRSKHDLEHLKKSVEFQRSMGRPDADYVQHGMGTDKSLIAFGLDHDHSHDDDHSHDGDHSHAAWPDPKTLEHADERTDEGAHNWGHGRKWQEGMPIPAPIISSLPVRSRSRGRWDGDGM